MAKLTFILQPRSPKRHVREIADLLAVNGLVKVLVGVAFVRQAGVAALSRELKAVKNVTTAYVGIRNDITSVQGLKALLDVGISVFAVDTGSRNLIFHPKVYFASTTKRALALISSANLTHGGLHNNIEAGTLLDLNLNEPSENALAAGIVREFESLQSSFPSNVKKISTHAEADQLLADSRVVDEAIALAPSPRSPRGRKTTVTIPRITLPYTPPPAKAAPPAPSSKSVKSKGKTSASAAPFPARWASVWRSNGLTERDLNIPKAKSTHPTGSMTLKKGAMPGIDQRHYFRDVVFKELPWSVTNPSHIERAPVEIKIVIANVDYGIHSLAVTHNTNKASKTYRQNNAMTSLFWNDARSLIANKALLGREAILYKRAGKSPSFILEID